ncbi:MAG: metalloregulator ArsR/SmtB family transcription factor [bacterium]
MNEISATDGLDQLDRVMAALAHPLRRQVLLVLHFRGGEMSAGDIAERFSCAWPTTSRHLRQLEESGLVSVRRDGRQRIYCLERELLSNTVGNWLHWFKGNVRPK